MKPTPRAPKRQPEKPAVAVLLLAEVTAVCEAIVMVVVPVPPEASVTDELLSEQDGW